jgi:hypothetical protein
MVAGMDLTSTPAIELLAAMRRQLPPAEYAHAVSVLEGGGCDDADSVPLSIPVDLAGLGYEIDEVVDEIGVGIRVLVSTATHADPDAGSVYCDVAPELVMHVGRLLELTAPR